ncbi:MAG TPA: alpha/beta hydrolase [Chloroflexia bacterium]|nr:alpha/beta hydrolase [Chloroflexia bacterium]
MPAAPLFVLVHSPLVGPLTWARVARELGQGGIAVCVPALRAPELLGPPYWRRHAEAVATALAGAADRPLVLAGHSGAGPLLPAIAAQSGRPIAAYLFVDAGLPADGKSRLDLFGDPAAAAQFRQAAVDGLLPPWTDADLAAVIPDSALRARFVAELQPLPLAVYEEPIPVFPGWPDAPCGYLQFSPIYDGPAAAAQRTGWRYRMLPGGHFHMLVDPGAVARALVDLAGLPDSLPHPQPDAL